MALILTSILSDRSIATSAFLSFPFTWNVFFHPFSFSLYVSFALRWVSYRQHIVRFCFFLQSALCVFWLVHSVHWHSRLLLINMYLLTFQNFFSKWFCYSFVPFSLSLSFFFFFFGWMIYFMLVSSSLFHAVDVIFGFDLWLPCFFKYVNPFLYLFEPSHVGSNIS